VVARFTARPAGAGASLGRSLGRSLVAVLSRGLLPPSPLMRARRHPLPRSKPAETASVPRSQGSLIPFLKRLPSAGFCFANFFVV